MNGSVLTVTQLNRYVKSVLDGDKNLRSLFLTGEISNLKINAFSGHMYFSLKDDAAAVKSVMFKSNVQLLRFIPKEGMKVICRGSVTMYERDGAYQFYAADMQPDGIGSLAIAFEQLKEKLSAEGLFDDSKKKPIPTHPQKIAIITSETGAAVQDMISVIGRRWPLATLIMCPVRVQGDMAANEMCLALRKVNAYTDSDVIIIGRGGGSQEDLWCFNDEDLARCIADSRIPVISAVGHETDYTICDYVADLRAPTPSAAAELCVPDIFDIQLDIKAIESRLLGAVNNIFERKKEKLKDLSSRRVLSDKYGTVENVSIRLDALRTRLESDYFKNTNDKKNRFTGLCAKLETLNPAKTFLRGYTITEKKGRAVRSVTELKPDETVKLHLFDGYADCKVLSTERKK